ncbi:gliding motility-associated C-terminal domain-containing protein, partial [Vibrio parahaemolyticus]
CPTTEVFLPNAFTPDGDGINDVFYVQAKGVRNIKSLRVFNRWGELVFEKTNILPNDTGSGWNGKIRGVAANPDVYVYFCEVVCEKGGTQLYKGNV